MYVPTLVERNDGVRAGVMLAGPYRTVDETLHAQAEKLAGIMRSTGASEQVIEQQLAGLRTTVESLRALRAGTFGGTSIDGLPLPYWQSWFDVGDDAVKIGPGLERPLLAISGDYDWNVPPEETGRWREAFGDGSIHRAEVLPCITHALNCISQPDPLKIRASDIGRHVEPAVLEAVIDFLDESAR